MYLYLFWLFPALIFLLFFMSDRRRIFNAYLFSINLGLLLLISAFLQVLYILNSCFQILYMCFLERFTYLFSILAYCACVFPVIIHAGSLFFALKHVFSDLLYIPNYDFWIIRMYFLLYCTYLILVFNFRACISWFFAHTRFLFLISAHVFSNALPK